ncbi:MAG TPA: alpha/beta fold hydrolase, partial [Candidatus Acidoferrales bacterium]|nr:alpha/beta fold hydrolase [Candidatus Acidoferrales bacterium]
ANCRGAAAILMKRNELILAVSGVALLAWGALWIERARGPMRDVMLDGGPACPAAPATILEPSNQAPRGAVVVFHGLGANRIVMLTTGQQFAAAGFRVYLVDSPGHGADTAPFSFAANEACARGLLGTLERTGAISARRTVLLGHSMGAALVVRLADRFPAAATIAVSTAPLVPPRRIPSNLLLVAPQFDMPPVLAAERHLAAAAGAERTAPEDFRELRAFRLLSVPWRTHTGALFDASATRTMLRWALDAVGAGAAAAPRPDFRPFYGGWLGLLGILLIFPAAASGAAQLTRIRALRIGSAPPRPAMTILAWTAATILAAILLVHWVPLAALHLYSAGYLASLLLLAGLPLSLAYGIGEARRAREQRAQSPSRSWKDSLSETLCGAILGMASILAAGAWLNWQLTEAWPVAARWQRFPFLVAALFPACLAEEYALGDPRALRRLGRAARMALFIVLRAIVWLVLLVATWSGAADALLSVIFVAFLGALSLGQRLGADALRHRTGSAVAAAVFGAILAAWFLAAAFPLA